MTARLCPKCDEYAELTPFTVAGEDGVDLTIDRCGRCRGVWLDWDELGPAKELAAILPGLTTGASVHRDHAHGNCPACTPSRALVRIPVAAYGVDRCGECEGLWFDGGELGPVLTEQGFAALLKALRARPA